MIETTIASNYLKNDEAIRNSLFDLAKETFGIDLDSYFKRSLFGERYIPFSCIFEGKVIANVSANRFDIVINGKTTKAVQLGTVITAEKYRNNGYASQLIKLVFERYQKDTELFFLFANKSALDFYPKLGFRRIAEQIVEIDTAQITILDTYVKKLQDDSAEDKVTLMHLIRTHKSLSRELGIFSDKWPLLVYCLDTPKNWEKVFVVENNALVICERKDDILHIYDIVTREVHAFDEIIAKIVAPSDKKVWLHMMAPKTKHDIKYISADDDDDVLFVKTDLQLPEHIMFNKTSHT